MPFDTMEIRFSLQKLLIGLILVIVRTARKSAKTSNAAVIIRQMGNDWAQHWVHSIRSVRSHYFV